MIFGNRPPWPQHCHSHYCSWPRRCAVQGPGSCDPPEGERARGAPAALALARPEHCVRSPGGDAAGVRL